MNGGRKSFFKQVSRHKGLRLAEVLNYIFLSEITYLSLQARQAGFPSSILKPGWGIAILDPSQFQCKSVLFGKASQIAFIQHLAVSGDLWYSQLPSSVSKMRVFFQSWTAGTAWTAQGQRSPFSMEPVLKCHAVLGGAADTWAFTDAQDQTSGWSESDAPMEPLVYCDGTMDLCRSVWSNCWLPCQTSLKAHRRKTELFVRNVKSDNFLLF